MVEVTVHQAKSNLSKLLRQVEKGEEVVICRGKEPIARIVTFVPSRILRPKVGELVALGVTWTEDCFTPVKDKEWEGHPM
jgi:prevent-host-death family protein